MLFARTCRDLLVYCAVESFTGCHKRDGQGVDRLPEACLIFEVNLVHSRRARISITRCSSVATNHRTSAGQRKLDLSLVPTWMAGATREIDNHSSLAASMPTPLHTFFCPCIICNPPVSALRYQFSNSPVVKSCEPEPAHLGAPQHGPEPKANMLSMAMIRLYAHEVADLSLCRILAQTAIVMDRTREQILLRSWDGDEPQMQRGSEHKFE